MNHCSLFYFKLIYQTQQTMKKIFYLVIATTAFNTYAQTHLIAHKSHSGSAVTYLIDPSGNFGEVNFPPPPPAPIENFIPLNDSTVVLEVTDQNQRVIKKEVLPNKERYPIALFEVKYRDSIRRQELEKQRLEMEQEQKIQQHQNLENQSAQKRKSKKKKNDLLLLSLLVGGGLTGFIALYKRLIYRTAL